MDTVLTTQRKTCENWKISLQPFIIVVGPLVNITAAYVIINSERIQFDSVTAQLHFVGKQRML